MRITKNRTQVALVSLVALTVAGCGGGGSSYPSTLSGLSGTGGTQSPASRKTGKATFTVTWPARTRLIPDAANSVVVKLAFAGPGTLVGAPPAPIVLARPAAGQPLTVTATFNNLELGTWNATATANPSADGSGVPQATKSTTVPFTVVDGANAPITLTMDSTITRLDVVPTPVIAYAVGTTLQLQAVGRDAANNIVITSLPRISWDSSNKSVATVSTTGLVTFVGIGTTTITVTDTESNKSATVNLTAAPAGVVAGWGKFHGDAQNTGQATGGNPTTGALVSGWPFTTGDSVVFSSAVVGPDKTIYIGSYDKNLYALNPDGTQKWKFATGGMIESSPLVSKNGTIYVGSLDGHVYAVNPDGSLLWQYPAAGAAAINPVFASPAISATDNSVVFGTTNQDINNPTSKEIYLYSVNGYTGTLNWSYKNGFPGIQTAAAFSSDFKTIYFGALDGTVFAVNSSDGTAVSGAGWPYKAGGSIFSSAPAVGQDGSIYIGALDGKLYALTPAGTPKWATPFNANAPIYGTPAISGTNGRVFIGSFDNVSGTNNSHLYSIDGATGAQVWAFPAPGAGTIGTVSSSPAIGGDGTIYFGSYDGNVYGVNPDGTQKWSFPVGAGDQIDSSPAIGADGTIYVGTVFDKVFAIK